MRQRNRNTGFASQSIIYIGAVVFIGLLFAYFFFKKKSGTSDWKSQLKYPDKQRTQSNNHSNHNTSEMPSGSASTVNTSSQITDLNYLPSAKGEIIRHQYYTLSYLEQYEQAEWVCYPLTKKVLMMPNVPRSDWFNEDPAVTTGSAKHFQYKGSGFTRGHLAPAGDMSFDKQAMEESFFMSNMSPQPRAFNNGVWRELEEQARDWVFQNRELYIVSGPIFGSNPQFFKKHKIAIPQSFYKILLDVEGDDHKAIAFVIPNQVSDEPLSKYAMSIDQLETLVDINFFEKMPVPDIEALEATIDLAKWPIAEGRYRQRVERWNRE